MTALRAWVGAMNPLNEGKVSHIIMLPTIEKMSLQIYGDLSSLMKIRKRNRNAPVVTGGIVWVVVGISIASEFAHKKAEERTKNGLLESRPCDCVPFQVQVKCSILT